VSPIGHREGTRMRATGDTSSSDTIVNSFNCWEWNVSGGTRGKIVGPLALEGHPNEMDDPP
jgi:hypothetical protein